MGLSNTYTREIIDSEVLVYFNIIYKRIKGISIFWRARFDFRK